MATKLASPVDAISPASSSGWFMEFMRFCSTALPSRPCLDTNAPMGLITSRVSPAFSSALAHVENSPPRSFFTATRISLLPSSKLRGSAQME